DVLRVLVALALALAADLHHELAVAGELHQMMVGAAVAAEPDEALGIGVDAVLGLRPVIALPRPAPALDEVAGLVERENGRRGFVLLIFPHRGRTLQDPGMATIVDRDARHLTPHIFARQLGPGWIDLEFWNFARLCPCGVFHLPDKQRHGG